MHYFYIIPLPSKTHWFELTINERSPWNAFRDLCLQDGMNATLDGLARLMEAASDRRQLAKSQIEKIRGTTHPIYEIKKGSGYRAYVWKKDSSCWVFLVGGKKATQKTDVRDAIWLVESYVNQH